MQFNKINPEWLYFDQAIKSLKKLFCTLRKIKRLHQCFDTASLVTPEGLEPPTDRTGICYSIQLNYGAFI
jgi:hypothetical protein